MSGAEETKTEAIEKVDAEVLDRIAAPHEAASLATVPTMGDDTMRRLADAGYPVLIENDATLLRAAFAHTQRLYAAILDPRDYLYLVAYKEGSKAKQYVSKNRDDAEKFAANYKVEVMAKPIKAGIVKLAVALGIEAIPTSKGWLKDERGSFYYEVVYKVTHGRSGRSEYGVGSCDRSERGGHIKTHDIITTADTRAYNRAILRLSGFGDVSADEIIAGADDDDLPQYVPEVPKAQPLEDRPPLDSDEVLTASRAWAEEIAKRPAGTERFESSGRQSSFGIRERRAQARRGDAEAARKLGAAGMFWQGEAQDGHGYPSFEVELPPVTPGDIEVALLFGSDTATPPPEKKEEGWDLSAQGGKADDTASDETATDGPPSPVPPPDARAETITTKQAKIISGLLLGINDNDRAKCGEWLRDNAHVGKSTEIRSNQYEQIISVLNKAKETA